MQTLCFKIYHKIISLRKKVFQKIGMLRYFLGYKNLKIANGAVFLNYPIIDMIKNSHIEIGQNSVIDSKKYKNPLGLNKKSILRTLKEGASIKIGNNVGMSGITICCMEKVIIHDNVGIGANTIIVDTDFHPTDLTVPKSDWDNLDLIKTAPVIIEENVMIGMNVTILKGVTIGKFSVVGAGSIVAKNLDSYSTYVNCSLKKIR